MHYVGEIRPFVEDLPQGWLPCDGRLLAIIPDLYPLFSVIGYAYGGDGDKFALPDLRDRVTAGTGHGQLAGTASGRAGSTLIPFVAVRWAIATDGRFPTPH